MSVASQLGLHDPATGLLAEARTRWPRWCKENRHLSVVVDLVDLPIWIRSVPIEEADDVLHTLARIASPTGDDDKAAAGALAWLLIPGAASLAHHLRDMTPQIDACVAAQLWIEVRSFPWDRLRKVSGNIVRNLRRNVLRELGAAEQVRAVDPTWGNTVPLPPEANLWQVLEAAPDEPAPDPQDELAKLLTWAIDHKVIDAVDRELLVGMAATAAELGVVRSREGLGGLCSRTGSVVVAARFGVSEATVRRRVRRSVEAVAAAYARELSA